MSEPRQATDRAGRIKSRVAVLLVSLVVLASLALVTLDRLLLPGRFAVNEVIVKGEAPNVDPAAVLQAVREVGVKSWFSVDLGQVESAVRHVPWVYRVSVRRRWPGKLVVTVAQASPFARYNDAAWINEMGETLALPADFAGDGLPRLRGPERRAGEVTEGYRRLTAQLAPADSVDLRSLVLDARGSWRMGIVGVDDDSARLVDVTVGRDEIELRVKRLAAALKGGLAERLPMISAIDLRYPNGFAVRPLEGASNGKQMAELKSSLAGDGTG